MAAFVLIHHDKARLGGFSAKQEEALDIFTRKLSLPVSGVFNLGDYTLYLYKKRYYDAENYALFPEGGFVASTGSLIYKGRYGQEALKQAYLDFAAGQRIEKECRGNYCLILKHGGQLWICRDYYGNFPVFRDPAFQVISSSFLITALLQPRLSVSREELYEYLINARWFGEKTLFNEVLRLRGGVFWELSGGQSCPFELQYPALQGKSYKRCLDIVADTLEAQFAAIAGAFPTVRSALSGGYDTRLMLAVLLKLGNKPHLHVNGTPNSTDVRCARAIAEGMGMPLEVVHFYEAYDLAPSAYHDFIMNRFYSFDGLGGIGVFDQYSDLEYRLSHLEPNSAFLHGGGGEIYREVWNMPNLPISLDAFVVAQHDRIGIGDIFRGYSKKEYLSHMKQRIMEALGKKDERFSRQDVEQLDRLRLNALSFTITTFQQLYPFLKPFCEYDIMESSLEIPLRFKFWGKFQQDLIRLFDARLASFMSAYGYAFDQKAPLKYWLKERMVTYAPLRLRPYLRKLKKSRKLPIKQFGVNPLAPEIVAAVLPGKAERIASYVKMENITDDLIRSRALTLELLFRKLQVQPG
jgi:asparagine synthase (glutamine-hydrolysing)